MPPVRSVIVERTPFRLPPGTVASGRKCLTDSRGCCPVAPVDGYGDCGTGSGAAREWELPETVYLTIHSTVPTLADPPADPSTTYVQQLLTARQMFSRVFPLVYQELTAATHPWACAYTGSIPPRTPPGHYWYWDTGLELNFDLGEINDNIHPHIASWPFGYLIWDGNRANSSDSCGRLGGFINAAPSLSSTGGFDSSGHYWTPGFYNNKVAAYPEPDGSWTFLQGAGDWASKYRGINCVISTAPPGPPRPRRVGFRSTPMPGRLRLDFEETVLGTGGYDRKVYTFANPSGVDWSRPLADGTVYLERSAECGSWVGETSIWGRQARFVLILNRIAINDNGVSFCEDEWGLAVQVGDVARIFATAASYWPWYYKGDDTFLAKGGIGGLIDPGRSSATYYNNNPCVITGPVVGLPSCTTTPLDVEFAMRVEVQLDTAENVNFDWPSQNAVQLIFLCRIREAW